MRILKLFIKQPISAAQILFEEIVCDWIIAPKIFFAPNQVSTKGIFHCELLIEFGKIFVLSNQCVVMPWFYHKKMKTQVIIIVNPDS